MSSELQDEAIQKGTETKTIKYLNSHPFQAIIAFMMIFVLGGLAFKVVSSTSVKCLGVRHDDVTPLMWVVITFLFGSLSYFIIVHVMKVPITAAFTL